MPAKLKISFWIVLMTSSGWTLDVLAGSDFHGLQFAIVGKGKASGELATVTLSNGGQDEFRNTIGPLLIFVDEVYSPVWIDSFSVVLAQGKSKEIEVQGISLINHMPVLPAGQTFDKNLRIYSTRELEFVAPEIDLTDSLPTISSGQIAEGDYYITYPGTDVRFEYLVDPNTHPKVFSALLMETENWLQVTYSRMQKAGMISTALKGNPKEERNFLGQLITWMYAGKVSGVEYNKSLLYEDLLVKFKKAFKNVNKDSEQRFLSEIERESERFFNNALKIGEEAGVFIDTRRKGAGDHALVSHHGGWCHLADLKSHVFVEDPLTCEIVNAGPGLLENDAVLAVTMSEEPLIALNAVDHELKPGRIFSFSGVLKGDLDSRNFALKIANSEEKTIKILPDPISGAFEYNWKVLNDGGLRVRLTSSDVNGNDEDIFVTEFQIRETEVTAGLGEQFKISDTPLNIEQVGPDNIILRAGNINYPLYTKNQVGILGKIFELVRVDWNTKRATMRVLWKDCCKEDYTSGPASSASSNGIALFTTDRDLISMGYKGVILPPAFGFKTGVRTIGIITPQPATEAAFCCGWQKFDGLNLQWETILAIRLKSILESKMDSLAEKLGPIRVILIDPMTRQLMANLDKFNEARSDENKIWPRKKLVNPDFVVENSVMMTCCTMSADDACNRVPVKVQIESMMIKAGNGIILTHLTSDNDSASGSNKNRFDMCYDPLSPTRNDFREYVIEQYCQKVAKELIDRLSRRI